MSRSASIFVFLSMKTHTHPNPTRCPLFSDSFLYLFYPRDSTSAASSTSPRLPPWLTVSTETRRPRTRVSRDRTSLSSTWGAEPSMSACSPWKEACSRLVFVRPCGRRLYRWFRIYWHSGFLGLYHAPYPIWVRIIFDSCCALQYAAAPPIYDNHQITFLQLCCVITLLFVCCPMLHQ